MAKKIIKKEEKKETNKFSELRGKVKTAKQELFAMQMDKAQGKLKNTSSLTLKRKEIARLLTALRQVELA
ncbi:MAG TPA: 50S ribosomal protein L29 [Patescibacteria group bacterium]